jgi:hypothetical protein
MYQEKSKSARTKQTFIRYRCPDNTPPLPEFRQTERKEEKGSAPGRRCAGTEEQNRAEQNRAEQSRTEQNRTVLDDIQPVVSHQTAGATPIRGVGLGGARVMIIDYFFRASGLELKRPELYGPERPYKFEPRTPTNGLQHVKPPRRLVSSYILRGFPAPWL